MKILGQDDWLIFARRDDGTLVFTVIETDPAWLDAPNGGQTEYGTDAWRVDNSWMQAHVTRNADSYYWRPCDTDTDGTSLAWPESDDAAFMARSQAAYLYHGFYQTGETR